MTSGLSGSTVAFGGAHSALAPPSPAEQIAEDDLVASADRHDLPVVATQRPLGPPPILDKPRFTDRIHLSAVDEQGPAGVSRLDGDAAWDCEATRTGHDHPSNGVSTALRSGNRESGSISRTRIAASGPAAIRT